MRRDRDCQKTTLAAIGKVGMPSVSGGYSTLDAFFGRADLMLFDRGHANNVHEANRSYQIFNSFVHTTNVRLIHVSFSQYIIDD